MEPNLSQSGSLYTQCTVPDCPSRTFELGSLGSQSLGAAGAFGGPPSSVCPHQAPTSMVRKRGNSFYLATQYTDISQGDSDYRVPQADDMPVPLEQLPVRLMSVASAGIEAPKPVRPKQNHDALNPWSVEADFPDEDDARPHPPTIVDPAAVFVPDSTPLNILAAGAANRQPLDSSSGGTFGSFDTNEQSAGGSWAPDQATPVSTRSNRSRLSINNLIHDSNAPPPATEDGFPRPPTETGGGSSSSPRRRWSHVGRRGRIHKPERRRNHPTGSYLEFLNEKLNESPMITQNTQNQLD